MAVGKLYVVGTPIGNLGDMTFRAIETLKSVDFIAAEDTRVSRKLLTHFEVSKPLVSYHEHNRAESGEKIVHRIQSGEACAIITDAGMPAISDPGRELVLLCAEAGIEVLVVPGPSAGISAAAISGMDTARFCFEGFLSMNRRTRKEHLESLKGERRAMIFYEAPHKLRQTLSDLDDTFGPDRPLALCRELTKIHEECIRTTVGGAIQKYEQTDPRGEFVLVLSGTKEQPAPPTSEDALVYAKELLAQGLPAKECARQASEKTGIPKNQIYKHLIDEKNRAQPHENA